MSAPPTVELTQLTAPNERVEAANGITSASAHRPFFETLSTLAFAERARRELAATGETSRRRSADTRDDLTAQEAQIAQLAGDVRTTPRSERSCFLSPRTVERHLHKIYGRVGVSSRKELQRKLIETPAFAVLV